MELTGCEYSTDRLRVKEWHSFGATAHGRKDLADVVADMLSERVTMSLPAGWQGEYSRQRARNWIAERDSDGPTLLATDRESNEPVGLVILHASGEGGNEEIRLGYLLAELAWGRGLATELIAGLVNWCRLHGLRGVITAGVDRDNRPSTRVLEKNGFRLEEPPPEQDGDLVYRLRLG